MVTLDTDPESFRLGIGDLPALELLEDTARRLGAVLHRHAGLWIGIIVSDDKAVVLSPIPSVLAVEGTPRQNGLFLETAVLRTLLNYTEQQKQPADSQEKRIDQASVGKVKEELANNPPQPEIIRVFNALFEFVELNRKEPRSNE